MDLQHNTYREIPTWVLSFFPKIREEFIEDPEGKTYSPSFNPDLKIPIGTLNIYGEFY